MRLAVSLLFVSALLQVQSPLQAQSPPVSPAQRCSQLNAATVPATSIALPTRGAAVTHAGLAHSGSGPHRVEFCKLLGTVISVDPDAQPIHFELNLPTAWNGKAVHFGGGGFDGVLTTTTGLAVQEVGITRDPTPLQRGYATFGSDSGHHHHYLFAPDMLNALSGRFATNPEQRRNYDHDALKKVHDTVVALITRYYGVPPRRMFFIGGSTGGREAYFVTQLWPQDYDGVLGAYAGWNQVELDLQFIRVSQAIYRRGDKYARGWLPHAKTRLVARRVMQVCDTLDGLKDGIISNPSACHVSLDALACPPGKDAKSCLTPGQLQTFQTFATEQRTAFPLSNGVQSIPGYNITSGVNLTGEMGFIRFPLPPPFVLFNAFYYQIADGVFRYFLPRQPGAHLLQIDTATAGPYAFDLPIESHLADASNPDLTPFAVHGGKFLMLHGTVDATIPTGASIEFYQMLQARLGQPLLDSFVRFYLVPGYGHTFGVFNAGFDSLGVLDRWVETDQPPEGLVVTDNNKRQHGRERPLCPYPQWPKYTSGDAALASSFICAKPE